MIETITLWLGQNIGWVALIITLSNRIARLTPTEWDNKTLDAIFGVIYKIFAIIGIKVPDIESVIGGIKVAK